MHDVVVAVVVESAVFFAAAKQLLLLLLLHWSEAKVINGGQPSHSKRASKMDCCLFLDETHFFVYNTHTMLGNFTTNYNFDFAAQHFFHTFCMCVFVWLLLLLWCSKQATDSRIWSRIHKSNTKQWKFTYDASYARAAVLFTKLTLFRFIYYPIACFVAAQHNLFTSYN